jgi:cell wall assembly regulator SMI1
MSYCEGDVTHTRCDNAEEFCAELRRISAWYAENCRRAAMIDPGLGEDMAQAFADLGLADLLH